MKKIINLIRCEFIKNYTLKNIILMLVILLISIFMITGFTEKIFQGQEINLDESLLYYEEQYRIYSEKDDLSYEEEFYKYQAGLNIEKIKRQRNYEELRQDSWQVEIFSELNELKEDIFVIKQIIDSNWDKYFIDIGESSQGYFEEYDGTIHHVYSKDIDELKKQIVEREKKIEVLEELLKENKYYKYLEYLLENNHYWEEDYYRILIDKKVESQSDYRAINLYALTHLSIFEDSSDIKSRDEFNQTFDLVQSYPSYEGYVRYNQSLALDSESKEAILKYAIENDMKHDLSFNDNGLQLYAYYMNTKVVVNNVLYLGIFVIIIVILTSGGIVSGEHAKGTERSLLTSPVKRWKVLLSKFIYLILHSYVIWGIALILIMLYGGMKYGFGDLFSPKLIYENGSVLEVNYILYIFKNIFICSIPVIAFLAIMLCLSTVTLSTSLTVGLSMLMAVISPVTWYLISRLGLGFLAYTPLPYFEYSLIINKMSMYVSSLKIVNTDFNTCFIISLVTIVVCYLVSNLIYVKRDVKN